MIFTSLKKLIKNNKKQTNKQTKFKRKLQTNIPNKEDIVTREFHTLFDKKLSISS